MNLNKINGNTYYINSPTNIGVFQFKDRYTVLIDTGNNNQQAAKIDKILTEQNMKIKYVINTHNHIDHSGGNAYFKEHHPGTIIYTSEEEKMFVENDYVLPMYLYGTTPIKEIAKHFMRTKKITVDVTLEEGIHKINDEKFEVFYLKGHAKGQIGIATKDRVCFLGDGIFSEEIIKKYSFPFLLDIDEEVETLNHLKTLTHDYYVLSHGQEILDTEGLHRLVDLNQKNINNYLDQIHQLLMQPQTRENLLEELVILNDLHMDFKEYHFSYSTIGAFLTYLHKRDIINYGIEEGKLYYYVK